MVTNSCIEKYAVAVSCLLHMCTEITQLLSFVVNEHALERDGGPEKGRGSD